MIQDYKAILRKIAKIGQLMKNGYGEFEELAVIEKKLVNEANKLYKRLKRKYKDLLEKFPEFKGDYGDPLYLLSIIPEIKRFKNTRRFLVYLGLRRNRFYNREARQALIKIACKLAKKQRIGFRRRRPNWGFVRKIALVIFPETKRWRG